MKSEIVNFHNIGYLRELSKIYKIKSLLGDLTLPEALITEKKCNLILNRIKRIKSEVLIL